MYQDPNDNEALPPPAQPLGGLRQQLFAFTDPQIIRIGEAVHSRLQVLGVRLHHASRLPKAIQSLKSALKSSDPFGLTDPILEDRSSESRKTILDLALIIGGIQLYPEQTVARLNTLVNGPAVPSDRFDHSRNIQAEMLVAASFGASGYSVDFLEPDLLIPNIAGSDGAVAVKRLTSQTKTGINKRLWEGRNQIKARNSTGVIVANTDRLLWHLYRRDPLSEISQIHFNHISGWTEDLMKRDAGRNVFGIIGMGTYCRINRSEERLDSGFTLGAVFIQRSEKTTQRSEAYFKLLSERMHTGLTQSLSALLQS